MTVNHLKNADAQNKYLAIAFGRQVAKGHLCWSSVSGASPNHQITAFNALGEGEWSACKGVYYKGKEITAANYNFHPGALATGMLTGPQTVDPFFPKDVPHSRTATLGYKLPVGLGDADTENSPPTEMEGIFETKLTPDFNGAGVQTDFSYSPNPARCIVELLLTYSRLPNLPSIYAQAASYWLSRIDWGNWAEFRDFHNQTETVDYRILPDFAGFGLTASYYSGTNFETFAAKFVHANFDINYGSQPPAANVSAGNFSGKFEGYVKFPKTEQYTFYITVDNGTRLWLDSVLKIDQWTDDGQHPLGSYSATFDATANTFIDILMHWNDGGGIGNFKVEWQSATTPRQIIPSKYLYPKVEQHKLYEFHGFFGAPISPGAAIRQILFQTNSLMQDTGKHLRFLAYEQLAPYFSFDSSNLISFDKGKKPDILQVDPVTIYEAQFKSLDQQYLAEPITPVQIETGYFARKSFENVRVINLFNTTHWRALKILNRRLKLDTTSDYVWEATGAYAKTFPVLAGDLVNATHRKIGAAAKQYLVKRIVESGVNELKRVKGTDIEKRKFVLQEWNN